MSDEKTQEDLDVELFVSIVKAQSSYDMGIDGEDAPDEEAKIIIKQFAAAIRKALAKEEMR